MKRLLLEEEAAAILRCSVAKIRRLRRLKLLPFVPGRPVTIDEADLSFYVECRKRETTSPNSQTRSTDEIATRARQKAIRLVMKRKQ